MRSLWISIFLVSMGSVFGQGENATVNIQFADAPIPFILSEYEKLTNKKIIRDAAVDDAFLSIETNATMTRSEAASFIEKSLLLNGFVLIPSGPDTLKVVTSAKVPRSEGVPVILHPADLPESDQLVTYLMSLTHVPGDQVLEAFRAISPSHDYGEITVLPDGASLAITDNSAVIRKYVQLQSFVDVPTAEQLTRSFPLLRSDALEVVELLDTFLVRDDDEPAQPVDGETPTQRSGQRILAPTVAAIPRTNRILVQAHPTQMLFVERLIAEFDAPSDSSNHITRALRYLPVLEFLPIAQDALSRGDDEEPADFDQFTQNSNTRQSTSAPFSSINENGLEGTRESLGEPTDVGGPRSLVVGHTLLIGDPTANELFASGPPEQLELLCRLLDHLDKKPRQIFLSTVIGQLTLGDNLNFGLDVIQTLDGFNVGGDPVATAGSFRTRSAGSPILDPLGLGAVADFAGNFPTGLTVYGQIGDHISVILDALEQTSTFSVISRPSVFTLNNEKAVIQTGQRVAVPVNTLSSLNTGTDNAAVASSIQYQDVVLRLEVIPLINSGDEVTLEISQVNDNIVGSTVVSGNEIPTIGTQELRTTVIVPNKATILLGGLISEDSTEGQTGLPILTRIPVVKHLSGTTTRAINRQELLIFIQPQIVGSEEELALANADTLDRTSIRQQALEFASSPQTPIITPTTQPLLPLEKQSSPRLNERREKKFIAGGRKR